MGFEPHRVLFENRVLFLFGEIDEAMAALVIPSLLVMDSLDCQPIRLFINSPGGTLDAGLAIYDTMHMIRAPVHTICIGKAASMGAWLLAAGTPGCRVASENARIMIHQGSTVLSGKYQEVMATAAEFDRMHHRMVNILSRHTRRNPTEIETILQTDCWLTSHQALEFGIVDRIAQAVERPPEGGRIP